MSNNKIRKQDALDYHAKRQPGKIEVIPTKDTSSQRDLALAYSPGVAEPCREIAARAEDVYKYTAKGNLVAVISNGTAVLGLGNIGPEASKPVMEGKGLLFKIFAGIDVFDIELDSTDIDEFINTVRAMAPTFGGINLEDIKAPDCFEIESRLKKELDIPIMHDDQHGTAIISSAGLMNALEIVGKKIEEVLLVVSGAGAAAISCIKLAISLGLKKENIIVCDSKGAIRSDRKNLSDSKKEFATDRAIDSLAEAMQGADVFFGLSTGNIVSPEMLLSMADDPIVFAMANPDPEIAYDLAVKTRKDVLMATGRSDHPNQVNNVLGFPFIFRGALDVRATEINEEMKLAAVKALAELTHKPVPDTVLNAYNTKSIVFGRDYIIPKPLDTRLLTTVAPAVARAAMDSGVAQAPITDWDAYRESLVKRMGNDDYLIRRLANKARLNPKRVVLAEAENYKILQSAQIAVDDGIARPILLGNKNKIEAIIKEYRLDLDVPIIDPDEEVNSEKWQYYRDLFYRKRQRNGKTCDEVGRMLKRHTYFGAMMVETGDADAMVSGLTRNYADMIRPALEIIGTAKPGKKVSSMYMMLTKNKGPLFFADTTILPNPTAEELADIAKVTAASVKVGFDIEPRIAMLSYSNFGTSNDAHAKKIRKATEILKRDRPEMVVDGEIQANFALDKEALQENFPFSTLADKHANVLIFPDLTSANIAYRLIQALDAAEAVGPILIGMKKPIHVLQIGSTVRDIVNMINIATVDAQYARKKY